MINGPCPDGITPDGVMVPLPRKPKPPPTSADLIETPRISKWLPIVLLMACFIQVGTAVNCKPQYDTFKTCIKNEMRKDTDDPISGNSKRQRIEQDSRQCCLNAGCSDPFPQQNERDARRQCFTDANLQIRNALQNYVKTTKRYTDFLLPNDDNDQNADWTYIMVRAMAMADNVGDTSRNRNGRRRNQNQFSSQPNNVCNNDNQKQQVAQCLSQKAVFTQNKAPQWRVHSCQIKQQCYISVNQQCRNLYDQRYKPALCEAVSKFQNDGSLESWKNQYVQCLQNNQINVQNPQNDDGRTAVAVMLNNWCIGGNAPDPKKDVCNNRTQSTANGGFDDGTSAAATGASSSPFGSLLSGTPFGSILGGGGGGGNLGGASGLLSSFTGGGTPFGSLFGSNTGLGAASPLTSGLGGSALGGGGSNLMGGLAGGGLSNLASPMNMMSLMSGGLPF